MTREELNEQIEELEKLRECVSDVSLASPALFGAVNTLKDIRDNGITDQKYTVQVVKNDKGGYLNACQDGYELLDKSETDYYQTQFTKEEIKAMKKSPELAIDWNKAIIEPVKGKIIC